MSLKARTHTAVQNGSNDDLVRLSTDPELREGLAAALQTVSRRCPGEIGRRLAVSLNERIGE